MFQGHCQRRRRQADGTRAVGNLADPDPTQRDHVGIARSRSKVAGSISASDIEEVSMAGRTIRSAWSVECSQ